MLEKTNEPVRLEITMPVGKCDGCQVRSVVLFTRTEESPPIMAEPSAVYCPFCGLKGTDKAPPRTQALVCDACGGSGRDLHLAIQCYTCGGTGQVW